MTKKSRFSLILVYCVAICLLFFPYLKQAVLIFQTQDVTIERTKTIDALEDVPLEAVQPPDLADTLAFEKEQTFQAIGQIIIPTVEIGLPIFPGLDNQQMLVGAGTLFPERTVESHNMVVVGHHLGRDNLLFGKLLEVTVGDDLYLEYQNDFYHYTVTQTKLIQQTDIQVTDDKNSSEITLITCDKPTQTQQRFIVKGKLANTPDKKTKQRVLQQKETVQLRNQKKDKYYCITMIVLLLLALLIGIRVIYKISE